MVNFTKKAIRSSFLKLLNERPFDKITVKDIAEDCGVNRNTFYYHYHDIYALLEEILLVERQQIAEKNIDYDSWQESFLQTASFAFANKKAIYHLYNSISRKQVESYINEAADHAIQSFVSVKVQNQNLSEEAFSTICFAYKSMLVGMLLQWLDTGMKQDAEKIIQQMGLLLDGTIDVMIQNAEKNNI